ncbi:MAG: Cna B-type domain-containing protein [Clostridiales bacterium]|nr:Cna B-type domain-containing protein [Clostridiales bacterium]
MGMKRELRKRLAKTEGRLRREGRRLASVFLCGALIIGNLSAVPVSVLADDDNDYTYEIEKTALQGALQTAVSEGNTVNEDLEFAGEHAEEYAELFEADGTLYELELSDEEIDEDDDRDKALDLRIFARIEGDIPVDEAYEIDGSEEIVFLVSNKIEKTVTATISVDGLETDAITILPVDSITVEEESTAVESTALTVAVSRSVSAGGSGGGSGSSSASTSEETAETESTEEEAVIEITNEADDDAEESASITEDTEVTVVSEEDDSNIAEDETDASAEDPAEEEDAASDQEITEDVSGDTETENTNTEDTDADVDDTGTEEVGTSNSGAVSENTGDTENDNEDENTSNTETSDNTSSTSTEGEEENSASDTDTAGSSGNTADNVSDNTGNTNDTSDDGSSSDITEDSDVEVLGSAISVHKSVLLAASKATDSNADETASASDADNAVDGIVYESVRFDKKGAAAFATTAADLKLDEIETEESMETVEYTAEADGVAVTVTASEGALPEDAVLSVTVYEEDSDEYAAAAEAIDYTVEDTTEVVSDEETAETVIEESTDDATSASTGLAVLDISFLVDGEEVEPTEAVTVSIDASGIVPEDADTSTIEVQHLTESGDGLEATLVADATDETEGTVDTDAVTMEFEVESFSTFTLQWGYTSGNGDNQTTSYLFLSATPYIYDTTINIGSDTTLTASSGSAIDLTSSNSTIGTITYNSATYKLYTATVIYDSAYENVASITVTRSQSGGGGNTTTTFTYEITYTNGTSDTFYSGSPALSSSNVTINLYYKYASSITVAAYLVSDDNSSTGSLSSSITSFTLAEDVTEDMENLADEVITSSSYTYSYTTVDGVVSNGTSESTISNVVSITYNYSDGTYTVVTSDGTYTLTSISSINTYYINTPSVTISSTSGTDDSGNTVNTLSTTTTNMSVVSYSWSFTGTGVDGNALTITGNSTSGWTVTDINGTVVATIQDNGDDTVSVTWMSESSSSVTGGTIVASVTATGKNGGTATDSYSMVYGATSEVIITVQYPSGTDDDGNTTYSSVGSGTSVTIKDSNGNTLYTETTNSNGQVTFDLVDGVDYVVVVSYSNGTYTYYGTITADATNGNTVKVSRVYTYYHIDLRVAGTFEVTVTEGTGQTDVTITKVWNDEGYESSRPSSITVSVENSSGTVVKTLTLTAADDWTYVWKDVDLDAGTYTVTDSLEGYTTTEGSFTIVDENTAANATTSTTYTGTITVTSLSSLVVYKNGDLTSTPIKIEMQAGTTSDDNSGDTEFKSVAGHGTNGKEPTSILTDYVTLENGDVVAVTITYSYSYTVNGEPVTGTATKTIYVTVDQNANICDGTPGSDKKDYGYDFVISASDLVDESDIETKNAEITNTYTTDTTTDLTIVKLEKDTETTYLAGAEFILYYIEDETQYYYSYDSTTGKVVWVENVDNTITITDAMTITSVDSEAGVTVHSLSLGTTYYLEEITAPDGYNLLSSAISFKIDADGSVTFNGDSAALIVDNNDNVIGLYVYNTKGSVLPETGGSGTAPFRIAGLLLTTCSAYLIYVTLRRRRNCLSK